MTRRVFVEFGAYGDIGDFEITEDMMEADISAEAWDIVKEFVIGEGYSYRIEEDEDEDEDW